MQYRPPRPVVITEFSRDGTARAMTIGLPAKESRSVLERLIARPGEGTVHPTGGLKQIDPELADWVTRMRRKWRRMNPPPRGIIAAEPATNTERAGTPARRAALSDDNR